ncbi:unnamed protein product [Calypogeia fissa]
MSGLTHDYFGIDYNRSLYYTKIKTVSSPSCYKGYKDEVVLDEVVLAVEFPWDVITLLTVVNKANNTQLRRQVLRMAMKRIRKIAILNKILAVKGLPPGYTIRETEPISVLGWGYEKFVDSLLNITDTSTYDCWAGASWYSLWLVLCLSAAEDHGEWTSAIVLRRMEERGVRTVFHGTNHAVMDDILKSGLDPSFRVTDRNWDFFGVDYKMSLQSTMAKTVPLPRHPKLLVFLVIEKPVGLLAPNFTMISTEGVPLVGIVSGSNKF